MAFKVLSNRATPEKKQTKPINKKFSLFDRPLIAYKEPNAKNNSPDKSSYHL